MNKHIISIAWSVLGVAQGTRYQQVSRISQPSELQQCKQTLMPCEKRAIDKAIGKTKIILPQWWFGLQFRSKKVRKQVAFQLILKDEQNFPERMFGEGHSWHRELQSKWIVSESSQCVQGIVVSVDVWRIKCEVMGTVRDGQNPE